MTEKERNAFAKKYIEEKGYQEKFKVTEGGLVFRLDEIDKVVPLPNTEEGIISNIEKYK
ncbi:hypothetical protein ACIT6Z_000052 [Listeria monocytogenes]|nr:hypothetical protein [Listeria monocytogenes]HAO5809970.1 hypothetical protein [Listeria monocytogenes]